jgi:broad specificity phosphatase PhoE
MLRRVAMMRESSAGLMWRCQRLDKSPVTAITRQMSRATPSGQTRQIVLVKHALPTLDASVAAREWRLGADGEAQARALAGRLRSFAPSALFSSPEPKAARTAELVGMGLGLVHRIGQGLEEFDRPVLPLLPAGEHAALNAPIFSEPDRQVLGRESGAAALRRFEAALAALVDAERAPGTLVIISHGTVIALLVAAHNDVDGFHLWRELSCASFVVLTYPGFGLTSPVERLG